ncbi:MAG: ComF family protein [Bacteroidales bacterium]|nr:ComF family protein [Bacteroidales bacterium]
MDFRDLKSWGNALLRVIFPEVCEVCGRALTEGENIICLHCMMDLPKTLLHNDQFNSIHQRLAGSVPIEKAAGYFYYYRESDYAKMIHRAKYNNQPRILHWLAQQYVSEIKCDGFFDGIDLIQPVPMHWLKKMHRGYNQSEEIAIAISAATGIEKCDCLTCVHRRSSQTRKQRFDRWLNVKDRYNVKNIESLNGKHILIVDDVITTGATILACCEAIHKLSPHTRLSVLSLGVTHLQ